MEEMHNNAVRNGQSIEEARYVNTNFGRLLGTPRRLPTMFRYPPQKGATLTFLTSPPLYTP